MGDTVQTYKCPCCDAPLSFNGENDSLHCASCGNDFSVRTLEQLSEAQLHSNEKSKFDWSEYTPRSYDSEDDVNLADYTCSSCGAQITADEAVGAAVCPYCGNTNIIKSQFEGNLKPDCLIPFKLDKKAAIDCFCSDFAKLPFLPDTFKSKKRLEEMQGLYVPFWLFDCDCNADITYNAQQVTSWSDSRYDYVKTDYYKLLRSGTAAFANIPADASKKMDDTYMEALEPYDYNEAVNFNTAYLSGFAAEKYDVTSKECIERANERVKNSTERVFSSTTDNYVSVTPESTYINFSGSKIRYALLPVWVFNVKYQNEIYRFAINGQTGKVAGRYPLDKKKRNLYFLKVFLISLAITSAAAWFIFK